MAEGLNRVMLLGNLGADPELRMTQGGQAVLKLRLATSENYLDKNRQRQERTEWHNIVLFDKLGEIAAEYLRKGSQVYIEGSLRTRKWQDKEGKDRYTTEIVARDMQMLGGRGGAGGGAGMGGGSPGGGAEPRQPRSTPSEDRGPPADEGGFDDDIPF